MSKIAILSDSHDNLSNLKRALEQIRANGAQMLLHCGDLCAPFIIKHLAEGFAGPIHIVFGNNDGDGRLLAMVASTYEHVTLHAIYAEVACAGRQIALIHYPEPALRIAQSGHFDLVCYGHNHTAKSERLADCFLVNPGEVLGMKGAASWGLYDGEQHEFEFKMI